MKYKYSFAIFFQAEAGIRDQPRSRGLGDVYKRQRVTSEMMYSRQVTRLLLRSASVTQDSALAASCDDPLAAGRVGRTPGGGSTQRATLRGLDCGYRVPHLAR